MPQYSLGIDIGGTFTDLVVYDHDTGARWSRKVLTTHDDPARAVASGVAGLLDQARVDPAAFSRVVHATTLFTNALIERKGAVTGLITAVHIIDRAAPSLGDTVVVQGTGAVGLSAIALTSCGCMT